MKLFKRTSITLSILIILLWTFLFAWVYYPSNNSRITDVEKEQTKILLKESNIKVEDVFLSRKGKALGIPEVKYVVADGTALEKACDDGKIKKDAENEYSFDESYITVYDEIVIIEGKCKYSEDVTEATALSKAEKLVAWLGLSQKTMSAFVTNQKEKISVTFIPEYNGRRIFDCKISVYFYKNGKYRVQTVPVKLKNTGEKELGISSCSALAELAMSGVANGSEIREMNFGYKTDGKKLIPVWEIKSTDGNVYYVN